MRPPISWLLGVAVLAGLALPAHGQDKLPAEGKAGTLNVDEIIRETVAVTSFQPPPGPGFNFEAGGEFLLLRPHFDDFSNGTVLFENEQPPLRGRDAPEYDLEPAFRIWLAGVIANGFGVRGRYFHIDADSDPLTGILTFSDEVNTQTLTTGLELNVLDVEGTVQRAGDGWFCLAAAGIRYARLQRTALSHIQQDIQGEALVNEVIDTDSVFEGLGPTFALEGRRRLFGNLSGFLTGRGSVVIGDSRIASTTSFDGFGESFQRTEIRITDNSMWVGEVQFGLEWARPLNQGEVFFRAALEAQYWLDGGHILEGDDDDHHRSPHDDLTLLGLLLGAGIRR